MNKSRQAGNVLLDFLGTGLLAGSVMTGILITSFLSTAQLFQKTELYFLARSRLYGNTTDCAPRPGLWPEFAGLDISYTCSGKSKVSSEMKFNGTQIFRQIIDLEGN